MNAEFDKSEALEYLLDDWVLCLMTEELPLKLERYEALPMQIGGGGFSGAGGNFTISTGSVSGGTGGSCTFGPYTTDTKTPETVYGLPVIDPHYPEAIEEIEIYGHYFRRSIAPSEDGQDWIDVWVEKKWFRTSQTVQELAEFIEAGHRHTWLTPDEFLEEVQFLAVDL